MGKKCILSLNKNMKEGVNLLEDHGMDERMILICV
jgi:hypothetical protein